MVTSPSIGYSPSPNPNLNKSRICENLCENLAEAEVGWIRKKGWNWPVVIAGYVSAMRICTRPLKHRHGEDDHISNFSCTSSASTVRANLTSWQSLKSTLCCKIYSWKHSKYDLLRKKNSPCGGYKCNYEKVNCSSKGVSARRCYGNGKVMSWVQTLIGPGRTWVGLILIRCGICPF